MHVAILHNIIDDGASLDNLDTLVQVEAIDEALCSLGHRTTRVPVGLNLADALSVLKEAECRAAFNLVESIAGSGRHIYLGATVCELASLPYTGCRAEAIMATTDKVATKWVLVKDGLPTAQWYELRGYELRGCELRGCELRGYELRGYDSWAGENLLNDCLGEGWDLILKPVYEDGSVGIDDTAVLQHPSAHQLTEALRERIKRSMFPWFAERYIPGREFGVSVIGPACSPKVLPHAEILFQNYADEKLRLVNYSAKWEEESFEYRNTDRTFSFQEEDAPLLALLSEITLACWNAFGLSGYGRVDFRVDKNGQPFVLEVNANPCITPDSGFTAAAGNAGLSYPEMIGFILECADAETR